MGIRGRKKTPQAISTSKLYFMDITAQVEANWKTSPFLVCLQGTGRDVLRVVGGAGREEGDRGKRHGRVVQYLESCLVLTEWPLVGLTP